MGPPKEAPAARHRRGSLTEAALGLLRAASMPAKGHAFGSMIWPAALAAVFVVGADLFVDGVIVGAPPDPGAHLVLGLSVAVLIYLLLRRAHGQRRGPWCRPRRVLAACARARREAQAHAAAAQRRALELEAAIAGMSDAVMVFDREGTPVCMNAATRAMWLDDDAAIPVDPAVLDHVVLRCPDGQALPAAELPWVRALQGEILRGERLLLTSLAGRELNVLISASPLRVEGRVSGAVAVCHDVTRFERLAVQEERQRLARELHDSLSQALYGIALGAHTAHAQLGRNATKVGEALDYILALAEAGLTEMRALIFELRPDSLTGEGLARALRQLAEVTRTRHGLDIRLTLDREPEAVAPVKDALYRIAQEALNNVVKHAQAKQVDLRLSEGPEQVTLEVVDDGIGFDPQRSSPGHLGLHSMQERARRLAGRLDIWAAPNHGTRIRVHLPKAFARGVSDKVSPSITFSRRVTFSPGPPVHLCAPQHPPAGESDRPSTEAVEPRVGHG